MSELNFDFPPKVAKKLKEKYPKASKSDIEVAFCGALSYFILCKKYRGHNIPMPSVVVDEVWHEFILHTRDYEAFCEKYLGFFLHHVPNDDENPVDEKIGKEQILSLWILACQESGFDPSSSEAKPPLFYTDVLFKERNSSYITDLAKDVRERVLNKKIGKQDKQGFIQTIKKGLGITAGSKVSEAAANSSGSFDLNSLLMTVNIIDDTPSYRSVTSDNYVPSSHSNNSSRNDDSHHHTSTSKHSCGSSHHSCSSSSNHSSSSCGSSCSSCGGGGD